MPPTKQWAYRASCPAGVLGLLLHRVGLQPKKSTLRQLRCPTHGFIRSGARPARKYGGEGSPGANVGFKRLFSEQCGGNKPKIEENLIFVGAPPSPTPTPPDGGGGRRTHPLSPPPGPSGSKIQKPLVPPAFHQQNSLMGTDHWSLHCEVVPALYRWSSPAPPPQSPWTPHFEVSAHLGMRAVWLPPRTSSQPQAPAPATRCQRRPCHPHVPCRGLGARPPPPPADHPWPAPPGRPAAGPRRPAAAPPPAPAPPAAPAAPARAPSAAPAPAAPPAPPPAAPAAAVGAAV